ncbi:MAG: ABC transporter ATP-binding protein, partial [Rhodococcus sp.]|nr:ABC transporter ATP-binding protein [Rhodococcus sp. (in: high G+C Gram-positive bacteria)]
REEALGGERKKLRKRAETRPQARENRCEFLFCGSHSNEFLAQLCDRAMWIDHGTVRQSGGIEEIVRAYEGNDAGDHVAHVIREMEREDAAASAIAEASSDDA